MSDPNISEFETFVDLLTGGAPDGYEPWLFRCAKEGKAPATEFGSWKSEKNQLTVAEAVAAMRDGYNIGIAGMESDRLVNVDIDDDDETDPEGMKATLMGRSRSRSGRHAWYFAEEDEDIPNIPTDDKGEVRSQGQYVLAPGSYVPTNPDDVPKGQEDYAGYYTVEKEREPVRLTVEELPEVFLAQLNKSEAQKRLQDSAEDAGGDPPDIDGKSAVFDVSAKDVVTKEGASTDPSDRWGSAFHGSTTGQNMSLSQQGRIQCWRHNVAHGGLQALVALSDHPGTCEAVGAGHKGSNAGPSSIKNDDSAIWHAWKYAKRNGYIPNDDPVPYRALKHICRERELCPVSQIPEKYDPDNGESLPDYAYDAAIETIEGHDDLDSGRKKTDEIANETTDSGSLDVVTDDDSAPDTPSDDLLTRVRDVIAEADTNDIQVKTARHRIAQILRDEHHFVKPEREVRGWREVLYIYNEGEGVYEPRGETVIKRRLERAAGDFMTNQTVNEIVAKVERMSVARGPQFKTPPERLVVGNGVLELHTGELDDYNPHEYHRTKIDVDWNPDAGDPEHIDEFLHDIVADKDVKTLYRLIAHTLYKEYVTEKAAMLIGGGQNGKSVFLDFLQQFLADENVSHRALQDFEERFTTNQLQGKLANIHPDMGDHAVKDLSTFKKLTGRDHFTADVKFESPIEFENYATLLFAANEMPVFGEDNHAVWRRWVYVEFPYEFREDKADTKTPEPKTQIMRRLTADQELEALLVRAQQEIQRWYDGNEWYADAMRPEQVRDKMKKAAEPVYAFAATCLEPDEGGALPKNMVRTAYQAYADAEDLPRLPENEFGKRLLQQPDFHIEGKQQRYDGVRTQVYTGVQLTPRGRQLLGMDDPDDDQGQVDDEVPDAKKAVLDRLNEMVEANDGEPVPKEGIIWGVINDDLGKIRATGAYEKLKERGDIVESDDGVLPT